MPDVLRPGLDFKTATALRDTARRLKIAEQQLRHLADAVEGEPRPSDQALLYGAEEYMRAIEAHRAAMSALPERAPEPSSAPPLAEAGQHRIASDLTREQLEGLGEASAAPQGEDAAA